jgi:uncharacterized damage-inducible protein DinB
MTISGDILRMHLDYTAWASGRVMEAATTLPPEDLQRDFGTADKTLMGTLVHVFGADRIWLARVLGEANPQPAGAQYHDPAALAPAWRIVAEGWNSWARDKTDEDFLTAAAYRDLRGNWWQTPIWQVVLHMVNHGTHHRGQAAGFMRSIGHTPPPLDLVAYYRSLS